MSIPRNVLLVGGYGLVGAQSAASIRRHHPQLKLIVAGRTLARAKALADTLGNAEAAVVNTGDADPLAQIGPVDAVVGLVHDAEDNLLRAAMRRGAAYVDITRLAAPQARAYVAASLETARTPVLFASNWMAGVPAILAVHAAREFSRVDSIALSVLFDRADKTGPDAADAAGALAEAVTARIRSAWRVVKPMSGPRRVRFPSGRTRTVYRMNMADVTTLAKATGARDVAMRIGLDSNGAARAMWLLMRLGLSNLLRSPAAQSAAGAAHEIVIDIAGQRAGKTDRRRITILDPKGQAHLTALGVLANVERVLGLTGEPLRPGVAVPETAPDGKRLLELLRAENVAVSGDI